MGAKDEMTRDGYETDNCRSRVNEVLVNDIHRAASVDDLFAPLCGLNVHARKEAQQSSSAPAAHPSPAPPSSQIWNGSMAATISPSGEAPLTTTHMSACCGPCPATDKVVFESEQTSDAAHNISSGPVKSPLHTRQSVVSRTATEAEEVLGQEAKAHVFSEVDSQQQDAIGRDHEPAGTFGGISSSCSASQLNVIDAGAAERSLFSSGLFPAYAARTGGIFPAGKLHSGRGGADGALPPSQSTSDDDQLNGPGLDERKQKRMLSNRESARRSRLRKQQHLDELRAQVARLRAENTDMMTRYGIASQRYTQITGENVVLRAHAVDLSQKLHQAHHELTTEHPNGLHPLGMLTGHMDHFSAGLPIYNH